MWEIVRKNQIRLALAFIAMSVWFVLVFGGIFGIPAMVFAINLSLFVSKIGDYHIYDLVDKDAHMLFFFGVLIALIILIIGILIKK